VLITPIDQRISDFDEAQRACQLGFIELSRIFTLQSTNYPWREAKESH
jgi:hypothetical protein